MKRNQLGPLLAFSHIPKTGGLTIVELLRKHFGRRHLDVTFRTPVVYLPEDLRRDRRLVPGLRSIAGHSLKPYVDFRPLGVELTWFTFLRDPVSRYLSHFQHEIEKGGKAPDLGRWMREYDRTNWQVRTLAGGADLSLAVEVLDGLDFVGILEEFDRSLVMLRGLDPLTSLNVTQRRHINPARSDDLRAKLREQAETAMDQVLENNDLDSQLYRYAVDVVYPRMLRRYGQVDDRGPGAGEAKKLGSSTETRERLNLLINRGQRNAVYKPYVALERKFGRPITGFDRS